MDIQSVILTSENITEGPSFNVVIFLIMIALIMCSAFFSMSETAFSSSNTVKLQKCVEERRRGAKNALHLSEKFEKTITTLLIGNNLVNTALSTLAVGFFGALIINSEFVDLISTLVITITLLIFGEIIPKMIAKRNPEAVAMKVAFVVYVLSIIFSCISFFFIQLQRLLSKKEAPETMDEDELEILIEKMVDEKTIEEDESEMIQNVFDLKERTTEDIMVPRIMMEALDYNSKLDEVKELMLTTNFSRIPVYKKDKDHIVGVLYSRDFFTSLVKNPKMSWKRLIRPVKFVSKAMKVDDLIREFQQTKNHLAIISGEYGDVLGLVTLEDALEVIVGEIYDEHDIPGEDDLKFEEQEDGSYIVDGEFFVEDLFDRLEIGDAPEDAPNKLSGWLFARCESIPEVGFEINYLASYTKYDDEEEDYTDYNKMVSITIAEVNNRRIDSAKVVVRDATEEEIEEHLETLEKNVKGN